MKKTDSYQLFLRSITLVMMLGVLFSSSLSALNTLVEFECMELCDFGDMDSETEKKEKETDEKVRMRMLHAHHISYKEALYNCELTFLRSHQYQEISTPPPEYSI